MSTPPHLSPELLRELAVAAKVCVRPIVLRCTDTETSLTATVPIPCGSTIERVCPSCAGRARRLRMQQCREGWHRDDEPDPDDPTDPAEDVDDDGEAEDQADELPDPDHDTDDDADAGARRVRSTRRRQDVADLPRVPMTNTTIGKAFTAPDGRRYRPSMFLTFTLPSYGRVLPDGTPADPATYDYRRAALDALHFPRLVDRLWQNLRRCAGYNAQYFAAVEAQRRLAPHLHAAVRGVIPRHIVRQVVAGTYHQLWWPAIGDPCPDDALPVWDDAAGGFVDPATGQVLPTWDQALDDLDADPAAAPAHVLRFGRQSDYQGILGTDEDKVGKAVGYLTKYLAKDVGATYGDPDEMSPAQAAHLERLHAHTAVLPCSPRCANWLRYGVQPKDAGRELAAGRCTAKAHDRHHLGLGGRRVLVSRDWTGKTLDRARRRPRRGRPHRPGRGRDRGTRHRPLFGNRRSAPTGRRATSGPKSSTPTRTPSPTARPSPPRSANASAGASSTTKPRTAPDHPATSVRQPRPQPEEGEQMATELLTVPEVMSSLRLSRAKVYDLIRAGELATVKIGRCRRITPCAVSNYIARLIEEAS